MLPKEYCELEELRKKLLKLGIGYQVIGKKGDKGDPGPLIASSNEGIFFTSLEDTNKTNKMIFIDPWTVSNPSEYFSILDNEVQLVPGLYEISFSGQITGVDNNNGGSFSLETSEGSEIKGLSFELEKGNLSKMNFSKTILFRFENNTILQVKTYINGDQIQNNVNIIDVNLYIKKIHE